MKQLMKQFTKWMKEPFMSLEGDKMDYRLMLIMFTLGALCALVIWVLIQL